MFNEINLLHLEFIWVCALQEGPRKIINYMGRSQAHKVAKPQTFHVVTSKVINFLTRLTNPIDWEAWSAAKHSMGARSQATSKSFNTYLAFVVACPIVIAK